MGLIDQVKLPHGLFALPAAFFCLKISALHIQDCYAKEMK